MKLPMSYEPCKAEFVERYKNVDISYSKQNGYEISGYWNTFYSLDDAKKVIDIRLNNDMKVSDNHGLIFNCL